LEIIRNNYQLFRGGKLARDNLNYRLFGKIIDNLAKLSKDVFPDASVEDLMNGHIAVLGTQSAGLRQAYYRLATHKGRGRPGLDEDV
jgi:hypothetical protein